MELGLTLANFGRHLTREATVALAQAAEELGFASVWTSEHLVVPADLFDPFGQIFDSLTTLTSVAALTERVRLGTSVLILPLHEPVLLAKQAATLHALSGGRLRLGVGVGWMPEEFALTGADFVGRAAVMDHHLDVLRHLLRDDPSLSTPVPPGFEGVPFAPAVESPLPVLIGGHARPPCVGPHGRGTAGTASGSSPTRCRPTSSRRATVAGEPASPSASGWSSASATAPSRAGERTS